MFLFGLFSGAESFGGGIKGVIMNSPNSLPWLILLIIVLIGWKYELIGGILISSIGIATIFAFDFYTVENLLGLFTIALPITILGGLLILGYFLKKKKKTTSV